MRRRAFLAGALFAAGLCDTAGATGGLEDDLGTPPPALAQRSAARARIRVLVMRPVPSAPVIEGDGFAVAGKRYRGAPSIAGDALIATLTVDAYLYGVVPLEAAPGWPPAALAVQAIVARTYALARRSLGRAYDVVAHEGDQVWGGLATEEPRCSAAVDATAGQVVTYGGGLASVFYSSSCGGHTADASRVWGGTVLPYLRGVEDPYCVGAPDYRWTATVPTADLLRALGARLAPVGSPASVALDEPAPDGRRNLLVSGPQGTTSINPSVVRAALGTRLVRSAFFRTLHVDGDVSQAEGSIVIEGAGRGHGVGLCQWGARAMASAGRTAAEILAYYFPGTGIMHG